MLLMAAPWQPPPAGDDHGDDHEDDDDVVGDPAAAAGPQGAPALVPFAAQQEHLLAQQHQQQQLQHHLQQQYGPHDLAAAVHQTGMHTVHSHAHHPHGQQQQQHQQHQQHVPFTVASLDAPTAAFDLLHAALHPQRPPPRPHPPAASAARSPKRRATGLHTPTAMPAPALPSAGSTAPPRQATTDHTLSSGDDDGGEEQEAEDDQAAGSSAAIAPLSPAVSARRAAHRGYTQKSREKVNARFDALLAALPPPPPSRTAPRSKADVLQYCIEQVGALRATVAALEVRVAISSDADLAGWLARATAGAARLRDVAQPVLDLLCGGMGWEAAEVWAVEQHAAAAVPGGSALAPSAAPPPTATLTQAWTFVPPPSPLAPPPAAAGGRRGESARVALLSSFLATGGGGVRVSAGDGSFPGVAFGGGRAVYVGGGVAALVGGRFGADGAVDGMRAAAVVCGLAVPLGMYGRVQMVAAFYGVAGGGAAGRPAAEHVAAASRVMAALQARYCVPEVGE